MKIKVGPSDRPADDALSDEMQSDLSTATHTQRGGVAIIWRE